MWRNISFATWRNVAGLSRTKVNVEGKLHISSGYLDINARAATSKDFNPQSFAADVGFQSVFKINLGNKSTQTV
jgi:hypothetical protein